MSVARKLGFTLRKPPLLLHNFISLISPFAPSERRALMFAVLEDLDLREVILMKRAEAWSLSSGISKEILIAQVPHISSDLAFWEFKAGVLPMPLFGLDSAFRQRAGVSWRQYRETYEDLILYVPPDVNFPVPSVASCSE